MGVIWCHVLLLRGALLEPHIPVILDLARPRLFVTARIVAFCSICGYLRTAANTEAPAHVLQHPRRLGTLRSPEHGRFSDSFGCS